jgi:hypothetical protein
MGTALAGQEAKGRCVFQKEVQLLLDKEELKSPETILFLSWALEMYQDLRDGILWLALTGLQPAGAVMMALV